MPNGRGSSNAGADDWQSKSYGSANELGDGAGYDVASFRADGTPVHIEVKTTNLGVERPFHITR